MHATFLASWRRAFCARFSTAWMAIGLGLSLPVAKAVAEGFRNPPAGGFGLGRSGGRFAQVDDSSAVVHNPANLTEVVGSEASLAPNWVYAAVEFSPASGVGTERSRNPWKFLPDVFGSTPLGDGRWAVGLGLTTPYGVSSEWDPAGDLHFKTAHRAELMTMDASPALAFKLNEKIRIGVAADLYWSQVQFKQFYPWPALTGNPGDPEGLAVLKGDGTGAGAHLGVTWDVTESQRVAVTYRSMADVACEGSFRVSNLPGLAGALGFSERSDFGTEVHFPNIVGVGYGVRVTSRLRLEADAEWVEFSRLRSFQFDIHNNNPLLASRELREDWRDTFTAGLGGDFALTDHTSLRGGYQYYESPVPDSTLSPVVPDSNQHAVTVGVVYRRGGHRLEFSYGRVFYLDRTVSAQVNPLFAGRYTFDVHLISAGYAFAF